MALAILAIAVLGAGALLLDLGTPDPYGPVIEALENAPTPLAVVSAAGRSHRILLLSDGGGAPAAIRLAGEVVDALARGEGLDALVLPVPANRQATLDAFLSGAGDAAGLYADPPSAGGPGLPLLPLLERARALNRELGAARSVRVIAADDPAWPPTRSLAPAQLLSLWAGRDEHMARVVEERVLAREARARVLIVADGVHGIRIPYTLQTGGTAPVDVVPLAVRLASRAPREVWSALVDPPPSATGPPRVASLRGSLAWSSVNAAIATPFAVQVPADYGSAATWLGAVTPPGITWSVPADASFASAWNAWIYLPR